jgi:hypothetical protein
MRNPITDKSLNIPHTGHADKFRSIRSKAKVDERERKTKAKRDKKVKVPRYSIGDEVVLTGGYKSRHYHLVEVIDFEEKWNSFVYYGVLRKTTDPEKFERTGRLIKFDEDNKWSTDLCPANVKNEKIKWFTGIDRG